MSIRRIRINPSLCVIHSNEEVLLSFDTALPDNNPSFIYGDVDVCIAGKHAMFQMEGVQCVPFSPATSANDTKLFSTMKWDVAFPNGDAVAWDGRATIDEYISKEHPARSEGPYKGLFQFASHVHSLVSNGKHRYAKREWADDSLDEILTACKRYGRSTS